MSSETMEQTPTERGGEKSRQASPAPQTPPPAPVLTSRDTLLARFRAAFADDVVDEAPGYGIGYAEERVKSIFTPHAENARSRHVSEFGLGNTPRVAEEYEGNAKSYIPMHPAREGQVESLTLPTRVTVSQSEGRLREVDALARNAPRSGQLGSQVSIYSALHRETAGASDSVNVLGAIVQLIMAQQALQSGARASTLAREPYGVALAKFADRSWIGDDPFWGEWTPLVGPEGLTPAELGVLAALCSPGGVSNFLWSFNDPDNPAAGDIMHPICRNKLPGSGVVNQLYLYSSSLVGQVPIGGRVFTPDAVRGLLNKLAADIPDAEMKNAYAEAAAYVHVYIPPERDQYIDDYHQVGAKISENYTPGPLGPHDLPPPAEPGVVRDPAGDHRYPYWVGDDAHMPIPRSIVPRHDPKGLDEALKAFKAAMPNIVQWNAALRIDRVRNQGIVVRVYFQRLDPNQQVPPHAEPVDPIQDTWFLELTLEEFGVLGVDRYYLDLWFDAYQGDFSLSMADPTPDNRPVDGPYTSYRNVYGAIDEHTRWRFPGFEPVHLLGVIVGYFVPIGAQKRTEVLAAVESYVAMQSCAVGMHWFFHRAMFIRGVDPNKLLYGPLAADPFIMGMPYEYRAITAPTHAIREMYPWGSWECLELVPKLQIGNTGQYVGYDVQGRVFEVTGLVTAEHSRGGGLAKLDAWARAIAASNGVLVADHPFPTATHYVYSDISGNRVVHPFLTAFLTVRNAGVVRANLRSVGALHNQVSYRTGGAQPFAPNAPVPYAVSRVVL